MRILTLCDVLFPQTIGGAGRVARELGEHFVKFGDHVHFLTRDVGKPPPDKSIPTTYYPPPGRHGRKHYRRIFFDLEAQLQPDIIHVHQPLAAFLSLPRSLRQPIVYSYHSPWPDELAVKYSRCPRMLRMPLVPMLKYVEGTVVRKASAVVVASRYMRAKVRARYGVNPTIIPDGVCSRWFVPSNRSRPSSEDGRFDLITLRNLVPRMGLENLIRAMAAMPPSVHLKIAGDGPLRDRLARMIRALGLECRVELLGRLSESQLPYFYGNGDLFVLPTRALEGFGLVTLESLACGTPVLGTAVGAIPEVLERFDPVWVIPGTDPQAMVKAILGFQFAKVIDRDALHRLVVGQYDWPIIAGRYRSLFLDVVKRSARLA